MKLFVLHLTLAVLTGILALAQEPTSVGASSPTLDERVDLHQDNTTTDQATKPVEPKSGTTLIGCLSGPDSHGRFMLRSMSHRTGVEVFGLDDLKNDLGSKVKLTGSWKPGEQPAVKGKEARTFQATEIEVLAQKCDAPSEKTPVSKQKQQQKQKASASPNGDTSNPK